jgi:malate dehydrogenase
MRPSLLKSTAELLRRSRGYTSSANPERKVAILGAAGGIGQPLSLLMKLNPLVSSLSLYDIAGTPGVAADVSHINSPALVRLHPTLGALLWLVSGGLDRTGSELTGFHSTPAG